MKMLCRRLGRERRYAELGGRSSWGGGDIVEIEERNWIV